jgi:hypothetical protein
MLAFRGIHEEFNKTIEICRVSLGRVLGVVLDCVRVNFGNILGASGCPSPAKRRVEKP